MKYIILVLILGGQSPSATYIPFDDMAACQDAKTVMMADSSYYVMKAYCFPSKR